MSTVPRAVQALAGCTVTRLVVDDAVTLALRSATHEVMLRIDAAGVLAREDGEHRFDPDTNTESVACLLGLVHRRVSAVHLAEDGVLVCEFGNDRLRLQPHPHQVSWSLSGPDGSNASCLAEGMVVWE